MSKWLRNMIALTLALSIGSCCLIANASDTDMPYVQEIDDEYSDISNKDIMTYSSGFDYAYNRLSWISGYYSAAIQQSCLASLTEEEAKNIDDVFSRTFNLLEKYEMALEHRNFEECKTILNDLSLIVPEIKSSLAPVLVSESLIGSPFLFDDEGLVFDEEGFLTEQGKHVTIIDDGFLTSKPSGIKGLNKWFGLFADDWSVPYYSLVTDGIAIWQLPIIYPEAFGLYGNMIADVSEEFSIDPFTILIVDGKYMVGEDVLRELSEEEKIIYKSVSLIIAAERGIKVDEEEFIDAVEDIDTKLLEIQIKNSSDYSDQMPFGEEFDLPNDGLSYEKII